ncbi:MAG: acyclic terpene utilization AtuA family protein, partial [Pseudolabrys sp.]
MTASNRILEHFERVNGSEPIRILGASGQLGYGVPTPAFSAGLARKPHLIGCDMGSIDPGPYYLGSGELATAPAATRRDLRKVILGALKSNIPLVIGSAGSAGAKPHLEQTLSIVREIAREESLHFRLGVLQADIDRSVLKRAIQTNGITSIDDMPALDTAEVDAAANIVGQMGMSAFQRALSAGVDILIAGRACDTAIFAALPAMVGFPVGAAQHMAKIIECASLCCVPGGRDSILATLDHEGFELESMAPQRRATPVSVAAHSLYEQSDPFTVQEPEGRLDLGRATYHAID